MKWTSKGLLLLSLLQVMPFATASASEGGLIGELNKTELEVGRLQEKIEGFTGSIHSATDAIGNLESELNFKNSSMLSRKKLIQERLKGISLYSVPERMDFLSAVGDINSVNRCDAVVSYMLKKDITEYYLISKDVEHLNELKDIIGKERSKLEVNKQKIAKYLSELKKNVQKKRKLLSKAQSTEHGYKALVQHFQKGGEEISHLVGTQKKGLVSATTNISSVIADLIRPVEGKIITGFGKIWDTKIRNWSYNKGVSVQANYGAEVKAVSTGSVSFSGWVPSYGRVLIIRHSGDMFSVYGHLAKILIPQGNKVDKGAVIAYVGDTGSVEKPTLYFELSKEKNNIDPSPLFD